jgi:hypothetical protein
MTHTIAALADRLRAVAVSGGAIVVGGDEIIVTLAGVGALFICEVAGRIFVETPALASPGESRNTIDARHATSSGSADNSLGAACEVAMARPAARGRERHARVPVVRFESRSCLDKAFKTVATVLGLGYKVSPRATLRSFQDLALAASVSDIVTRAISGHATEAMQQHYSTVGSNEMRRGLAAVIDIATGRERRVA